MERNYTHEQIAIDFRLWAEYFDTGATMTEAEFDAMTVDSKTAIWDLKVGMGATSPKEEAAALLALLLDLGYTETDGIPEREWDILCAAAEMVSRQP